MKGPLQLQLQWCGLGGGAQPSNHVVHPLVAMFPWVWAEPLHVGKYVELCHQVSE
jgi:hypothetical protein